MTMGRKTTIRNTKEAIAQSWCLKNEIIIYAQPTSPAGTEVKIIINYKGEIYPGKIAYKQKPSDKEPFWWDEIKKLYVYYYEKDSGE